MDIGDQRRIEQLLRFFPELVTAFSVPLRICHQSCHQLQNVLLAMHVGERIISHGLFEIDGVKNLDPIPVL